MKIISNPLGKKKQIYLYPLYICSVIKIMDHYVRILNQRH
jgi:hypothetical protein